jgi:hypothetical protein
MYKKQMYNDNKEYLEYLLKNKVWVSSEPLGYEKLPITVLNQQIDFEKCNQEFLEKEICVIDNFFNPGICERLRRFMLGINIREDIYESYAALNYNKEDRFWFRLLSNVSEEIQEKFTFLKDLKYTHGWSFIHDNKQTTSVLKHTDTGGLITFNVWCTPNECIENNSKELNGVVISDTYDKNEWDNAKKTVVNYNYNRVVIFKSKKMHESQNCHFKSGYENRKVNYTFLYA